MFLPAVPLSCQEMVAMVCVAFGLVAWQLRVMRQAVKIVLALAAETGGGSVLGLAKKTPFLKLYISCSFDMVIPCMCVYVCLSVCMRVCVLSWMGE